MTTDPRIRNRQTVGTRLHRVYSWLSDGIYDRLPQDGADWPLNVLNALIERPGRWVLCKLYGHEPVRDQCGRPEHDFCGWCNRPMPGGADR
jgi:hypothetical protein